ncbi:MAG: hypothetical protein HXX20_15375 [Chloroflexi bacterium]|nr:hypothetical protein [Chloroflexota bacterium]
MKIVAYRITLLEPVLVTSLNGDPNSAISHDYLPGSVLKGTLIGLAMRQAKLSELDLADSTTRRRFFDGNTRFLNGYLRLVGKRSVPAPRSWEQLKYAENDTQKSEILDRAIIETKKTTGKTKSLADKFTVFPINDSKVYVEKPQHVINIHTERERKLGRSAGKDSKGNSNGTIYRYEALEAGQTFEAHILCDEDSDAPYFAKLIKDHPSVVIGGSRSAGYGRVVLHDIQVKEFEREVGGKIVAPSDSHMILTLLSDTILRDKNGQYSPDVPTLLAALAARLNKDVEHHLTTEKVFKSESIAGGFNRKWGLPLPQVQALAMGSVFVIDLTRLSDAERTGLSEKLQSLEWLGLGERRSDGFGRVAIGWQQHEKLEKQDIPKDSSQSQVNLTKESDLLWQKMKERIKRRKTDLKQVEEANRLELRHLPPTSQLNRLRQQITSALLKSPPDTNVITYFFTDINGKRAEEHFKRARVKDKPMKDWLIDQAQESDKYSALRLIDAMLARAAKLNQKEESQRGVGNE